MELSIVLSQFNNKQLSLKNLGVLGEYLSSLGVLYEIILVDDGSSFKERITSAEVGTSVKIIQLESNMGKGHAVKRGMLAAAGDCCIFTDIDLPYDLTAIPHALGLVNKKGIDCVVGDRTLFGSIDVAQRPLARKVASRIFSKGVSLLIIGGIVDSQCGFKAFSGRLTRALFPLLTINRFSFDVEIYYLLLRYNILMKRIPVRLQQHDVSTVSLLGNFLEVTRDVLSIPFNWYRGRYSSDELKYFYREDEYWKIEK